MSSSWGESCESDRVNAGGRKLQDGPAYGLGADVVAEDGTKAGPRPVLPGALPIRPRATISASVSDLEGVAALARAGKSLSLSSNSSVAAVADEEPVLTIFRLSQRDGWIGTRTKLVANEEASSSPARFATRSTKVWPKVQYESLPS